MWRFVYYSLHPNGHTIATGGLATIVQLWDCRKFASTGKQAPKPFAWQHAGRSINSAFFSPSGSKLLSTTQANNLDILENAHLHSGLIATPYKRVRHDNQTGRWLATLMAKWHPTISTGEEIFVVGSMAKPRTVEVFGGTSGKRLRGISGDALTAVASRCCFHPNPDKLVIVGGNSSGRVTVAK